MVFHFLRALLSGSAPKAHSVTPAEPVSYAGYTIVATPKKVQAGWTTEGTISKEMGGVLKFQHFIRVDTHGERDDAIALSITKAKKIIDEQGDKLFKDN